MQDGPTQTQIEAAVRLMDDAAPAVVAKCHAQLVHWGESSRVPLQRAASCDSARLRVAARRVLRSLDLRAWTGQLAELGDRLATGDVRCSLLERGVDLVLRLGQVTPSTLGGIEARLDEFTAAVATLVVGRTSTTAARRLGEYLGGAQGFRGCTRSYYHPDHLFLDRVVERRRGLSVSLVALYLMVGRRAGLDMKAVRLDDDYFLVRIKGRRAVLIDPFHAGRTVTKDDCLRYLRRVGVQKPSSSLLRDVDDTHVLRGMMTALGRVHDHREDREFREALQQAQRSLSML